MKVNLQGEIKRLINPKIHWVGNKLMRSSIEGESVVNGEWEIGLTDLNKIGHKDEFDGLKPEGTGWTIECLDDSFRYEQWLSRLVGVKRLNAGNREEVKRLREIESSFEVNRWMKGRSKISLIKFITGDESHQVFGVTGAQLVMPEEKGKLQGWIYFYRDREVKRRMEWGLKRRLPAHELFWEVSFAKHPLAARGQLTIGLQILCGRIVRSFNRRMLIVAFVEPENIGSIKVLERAGFKKQEQKVNWNRRDKKSWDEFYIFQGKK